MGEELLRVYALLVRMASHKGMMIAVDEVELIATSSLSRRNHAFQALRSLIDNSDPRRIPPSTCVFLAATPMMFQDQKMFPSCKALQDRIERVSVSNSNSVNYRATIIDLDQTPLSEKELLGLAEAILDLTEKAGLDIDSRVRSMLPDVISIIVRGGYSIARPRLLCKCVIDLVDGEFDGPIATLIAKKALSLAEKRQRETKGSK
jgi:hypothetical protein